jgi:hypothetical protein
MIAQGEFAAARCLLAPKRQADAGGDDGVEPGRHEQSDS